MPRYAAAASVAVFRFPAKNLFHRPAAGAFPDRAGRAFGKVICPATRPPELRRK